MQAHGDAGGQVRRARRVWNAGSRLHGEERAIGRLQREVWPLAVRALGLEQGQAVLDVGCGAGHAFGPLREAVGEQGRIVGVDRAQRGDPSGARARIDRDVSPKMLAAARVEVGRRGWANVELCEADASAADLGQGRFDAALGSFSLSTVPDLAAAIDRIHVALRPGGRLFVIDAHFRPGLPRLARLLYRGVMGANGDDVLVALRARFDRVEPVVGADGAQVPFGEVAWPPVAAGLATKADRTNFDNV